MLQRTGDGAFVSGAAWEFLGMPNGIATHPLLRRDTDAPALAAQVSARFLYGFLAAAPSEEVTP